MTLCRLLLLRSIRRYSSSPSNPFPFHNPISASPADTPNHPSPNPQYPNTSNPGEYYSSNTSADSSNNHHNYQNGAASSYQYQNNAAPNYQYNPSYSAASNYQYNPQNTPSFGASNYQNTPFSGASSYQHNPHNVSAPTATPISQRSHGFSSAEEAAAERRRRKRRMRVEPPLFALRSNTQTAPTNANNNRDKPRLPDSTSALVGPRLNLHNRCQSLRRAGDLDSASYIARQAVFQHIRPTVFTCNGIITAMIEAKRYDDAKALFQYFFRQFNIIPNIVSYNMLIIAHCESNEVDEALKVYADILENAPYSPSSVTYRNLTKGLIDAGRIDDAVELLREMLQKGHGADSLVYNNVIRGYLNLGNLEKANEFFDELKERCPVFYDGVVNATFMDWFFNQGKPKEAMESYKDLMFRNYKMGPATQNVLLETLLRHGKKKEAWDLFNDMLDAHTPPIFQAVNSETFNMMVNECFKEGKVEEAVEVFKRAGNAEKSRPFQMDVAGFNNMIARMSELEMMDEAEQYYKQICDKSLSPDVNSYRTLIDAYLKLDRVDNVLEKFDKMAEAGLRVIPPYANKWFGFLVQKGRASDCLPILQKMEDKEPKPDVTTYDIVIRGLVEEGNFDATADLLKGMMNQGVGTTASLKGFVLDVFERQGRGAEIENILKHQRSYPPPQGQPQGATNPSMPWQTNSDQTRQPQVMEQIANRHPVSGQEEEFPRVAGQNAA